MFEEKLGKLRDGIDGIDMQILSLLNKRAGLAQEVGAIKKSEGKEFYVPSREKLVLDKLVRANKGPFPDSTLKIIFREIMSASLSLEEPLKVAFLGPDGTFTHNACLQQFGSSARFVSKRSISDVFCDVELGKVDFGVVPVENSNEGMVTHTLDRFVSSDVGICGEILLPVSHCLMNKTGRFEDVKKIYSHPQPIAQCRNWLSINSPDIPVLDVASTALAAEMANEDEIVAAIAGESAASVYGLRVVEEKIEDNPNNVTRFLIIGKNSPAKTGEDKTSILFSIKDEAGLLYKMLEPLSISGVNLTKIESRPLKTKAWEYIFFIDMEGHLDDENIAGAIDELKKRSKFLKVLGSYPSVGRGI